MHSIVYSCAMNDGTMLGMNDNMIPEQQDLSSPFPRADALLALQEGCHRLGIALTDRQLHQFQRYHHELVRWNERFNLTSITEYSEVQVKHFLDCLVALPYIAEEVGQALPLDDSIHLADVGTGAGFPGIPLKIVSPAVRLTLVDGTGKKIRFLNELIHTLELTSAQTVQGRAEELSRAPAYREQYNLVTARAVAALNTLAEYLLPLVSLGGYAVIYKGASAPQEFMDSRSAIELLGGETVRLAPVEVPLLDAKRFLILIKKVRPTPDRFPRGQGLARKQPLT